MTAGYRELDLGQRGIDFVASRLRAGNTFARAVERTVLESAVSCVTRIPTSVNEGAALRFSEGGLLNYEDSLRWVVGVIQGYLEKGQRNIVVLEDATSRRGDSILDRLQAPIFYLGQEVYRVLSPFEANTYSVEVAISESMSPHQLLAVMSEATGPLETQQLEAQVLDEWASRASGVVALAYDGEGFVYLSCR